MERGKWKGNGNMLMPLATLEEDYFLTGAAGLALSGGGLILTLSWTS